MVEYFIIISGLHLSFHPNFKEKHVTFVTDSHNIRYDFLKKKNTICRKVEGKTYLYRCLTEKQQGGRMFYQELESLVSSKITKGACRKQLNNLPKTRRICEQYTYWICSIKMNELTTKSYLAEINVQNRFCKFSEHGTFELGAKMETSNSIDVDHLESSSLDSNNWKFCF